MTMPQKIPPTPLIKGGYGRFPLVKGARGIGSLQQYLPSNIDNYKN
ncbi:MAG: hypothetical protein CLLPBCKN_003326 [Chroococcidiopsis cubana SAG 39.79]|nr:hypothetical protein [Chroococcidiopsis cubana SAG 39.79]